MTNTEAKRALRAAGIRCDLTFWFSGKVRLRQAHIATDPRDKRTLDGFVAEIVAAIPGARVLSQNDELRPWPNEARFVVDIMLPQAAR